MCSISAGLVGPFGVEPGELVAQRMLLREDLLRPLRELDGIALDRDREAVHRDAVDDLQAWRQLVLPRDVVAMRAGRQHLDLDVLGQVLGHVPRMLLGAAVDVGAVPLNDDRDLHCDRLCLKRVRRVHRVHQVHQVHRGASGASGASTDASRSSKAAWASAPASHWFEVLAVVVFTAVFETVVVVTGLIQSTEALRTCAPAHPRTRCTRHLRHPLYPPRLDRRAGRGGGAGACVLNRRPRPADRPSRPARSLRGRRPTPAAPARDRHRTCV